MSTNDDLVLSQQIENLLVASNPRGMQTIQPALQTGYYLRAAQMVAQSKGAVLIATGFPVKGTFETDGPLGAVALYRVLSQLGANPVLVCCEPLASVFQEDYQTYCMPTGFSDEIQAGVQGQSQAQQQVKKILSTYEPELIITIELPGRGEDGFYYNMKGVNISDQVMGFDDVLLSANCPSICIGDGGNEVGMGNIVDSLSCLDIIPCATKCDELVIADVSNWAAHGIIAMLSNLIKVDLLSEWDNHHFLEYFSRHGSVDGVTGEQTLTEDGLPCEVTDAVITQLRNLSGFS
jgi:hypothetical protein